MGVLSYFHTHCKMSLPASHVLAQPPDIIIPDLPRQLLRSAWKRSFPAKQLGLVMYELTMETLQHSTWQLGLYPVRLCVHDLSNRSGMEGGRREKKVETPHIRGMNTPEHGEKRPESQLTADNACLNGMIIHRREMSSMIPHFLNRDLTRSVIVGYSTITKLIFTGMEDVVPLKGSTAEFRCVCAGISHRLAVVG